MVARRAADEKWTLPEPSAAPLLARVAFDTLYVSMPICRNCEHGGRNHNWVSPACSRCGGRSPHCPFCFENYQRGRKRGQCQHPECGCGKYVPAGDGPRPVNKVIGRALYRKRR
jgi:hypothetical protein